MKKYKIYFHILIPLLFYCYVVLCWGFIIFDEILIILKSFHI